MAPATFLFKASVRVYLRLLKFRAKAKAVSRDHSPTVQVNPGEECRVAQTLEPVLHAALRRTNRKQKRSPGRVPGVPLDKAPNDVRHSPALV